MRYNMLDILKLSAKNWNAFILYYVKDHDIDN